MPRKPPKDDTVYLLDMFRAAQAVLSFVDGRTLDEYQRDLLLRSAVERQVEIIGEAARHVSRAFRTSHPAIAWSGITAQRHILAHEYAEILDERVWRVATVHVRTLAEQLKPLLPIDLIG